MAAWSLLIDFYDKSLLHLIICYKDSLALQQDFHRRALNQPNLAGWTQGLAQKSLLPRSSKTFVPPLTISTSPHSSSRKQWLKTQKGAETLCLPIALPPLRYVRRDPRLPETLARIRRSGRKTFLLTNSDWWSVSSTIGCFDLIKQDFYGWRERYRVCFFSYLAHWHSFKKHSKIFRSEVVIARYTRHIMAWVIGPQWITCFDLVCMIWFLWFHWGEKPDKPLALQVGVDACKPRFFQAGTPLQVKSEKDNQVKTWAPSKARTW